MSCAAAFVSVLTLSNCSKAVGSLLQLTTNPMADSRLRRRILCFIFISFADFFVFRPHVAPVFGVGDSCHEHERIRSAEILGGCPPGISPSRLRMRTDWPF